MSFDIVISYRRDDSQATSQAIYRELARRFGEQRILLDITSIPVGENYDSFVRKTIASAKAVIIVIGPRWTSLERNGMRRLHDPTDTVRGEVETALQSKVAVLPLLVDGATAIDPNVLPEPLQPLVHLNMMPIDPRHWDAEMKILTDRVAGLLGEQPAPAVHKEAAVSRSRTPLVIGAIAALAVVGTGVAYFWPVASPVTQIAKPIETPIARPQPAPAQPTPVRVPVERRPLVITNIHESGRPRMYTLVFAIADDLNYGAGFASLRRGSLQELVQRYVRDKDARFAADLRPYLQRLRAKDHSLVDDTQFKALLTRVAGEDPVMPKIQDALIEEHFNAPAREECKNIGIKTALGYALIADVRFNVGPYRYASIKAATVKALDGTPMTDIEESVWLREFARQAVETQSPSLRKLAARRMSTFTQLMDANDWTLAAPVRVGAYVLVDP